MKKAFLTFCLLFSILVGCTQTNPKKVCGVYLGEKYTDYIIISPSHDSLFFDMHSGKDECYGCNVLNVGRLSFGEPTVNNAQLTFSGDYAHLTYKGNSYKKVTLADSKNSYADSLLFYAGVGYLLAAKTPENASRMTLLLRPAIPYFKKSIELNKNKVDPYLDYGLVYYNLDIPDSAKIIWEEGEKIAPEDLHWREFYAALATLYLHDGMVQGKDNPEKAAHLFLKGIDINPLNSTLWYNLGGALFTEGKYAEAKKAWEETLRIEPDNADAQRGLNAIEEKK